MAGTRKLTHADGTEVTAQEAYDAFMNTRVLIFSGTATYEVISMLWYDTNSAQEDPTNVGHVELRRVTAIDGTVSINKTVVGDSSLVPA